MFHFPPFRSAFALAALLATALALGGCATGGAAGDMADGTGAVPPLAVRGSTVTLEIGPILLAARDHYPQGAEVRAGGIPNLVGAEPIPGFRDEGAADIAGHAETQALRYSLDNPDIRIILTVTEGHYRLIARRSAGIETLADLKGKRIATLATTSSGFFLARMLEQAGLGFADIDPVRISPIEDMAGALARREVDAVAIWDPHADNAELALDGDVTSFSGKGIYRELYNLNSTAANLADPEMRPRIVAFVVALLDAVEAIASDPAEAQALVSATSGLSLEEVARSWPHLSFRAALPDDLIDVLFEEEKWLAQQTERAPRSCEELARLIDASVLSEALAIRAARP